MTSDKVTTDSVRIVETLRDTVVTVQADSSLIRALVECDSLGQAHIRQLLEYQVGDRMKPPQIVIRDNVLTATAHVDSLAIYMQLKDRYKEAVKREQVTIRQIVETNKLTWRQTLFYWLGIVTAIGCFAWRVLKYVKR